VALNGAAQLAATDYGGLMNAKKLGDWLT